jgi:hypothetical protein
MKTRTYTKKMELNADKTMKNLFKAKQLIDDFTSNLSKEDKKDYLISFFNLK